MYRSILVPLDGSAASEQALPIACAIARRAGATLHLAHVHTPYGPIISIDGLPVIDDQLCSRARDHDQGYLDHTRARLEAETGGFITCTLLDQETNARDDRIAAILAHHAAELRSDLIVIGTRALSPLLRLVVGGVAADLGRMSGIPTLLVQARERQAAPGQAPAAQLDPCRRILIALDGSARAEHILTPVTQLGKLTAAEYLLLHVVKPTMLRSGAFTPPINLDPAGTARQRDEAELALAQLAAILRAGGSAVATRVVVAERPGDTIVDIARQQACDLIAMTVRERRGLARLLDRSISNQVLRKASVPLLLLYRPEAHREARGRCASTLLVAPYYQGGVAYGEHSRA
jgi:nucleotide-binding universal stress UspA family protein